MTTELAGERPTETSMRTAAEQAATDALGAIERLRLALDAETECLRDSRLPDAFALADEKAEAARAYMQVLGSVRDQAIAIGRWAPDLAEAMRSEQAKLASAAELNLTVLATLRAVSEGLMRGLAQEVDTAQRLTTYSSVGQMNNKPKVASGPLALSARI